MERVTIVIPIRDEAASIGLVLDDLCKVTSQLPQYEFETIVVDDGSRDGGADLARAYGARVGPNGAPHGKGAALRAGFAATTGSIIVMMDGDHSHRPEDLPVLLDALKPGVGLVIGSRIYGGSDEYTPVRAFGNIVLTYMFGLFHGRYLSDALNGYKAFRREVFTRAPYTSVAFEIEIELIINALRGGGRVVEVASHERSRAGGRSKSSIVGHGLRFLARIVYEWARAGRA
jgi:glycosyltransferase involved in cell wall biosynthesis